MNWLLECMGLRWDFAANIPLAIFFLGAVTPVCASLCGGAICVGF